MCGRGRQTPRATQAPPPAPAAPAAMPVNTIQYSEKYYDGTHEYRCARAEGGGRGRGGGGRARARAAAPALAALAAAGRPP